MNWKAQVTFRVGNITDSHTDAIVNAANTKLILGSGVSGAIRIAGGPAIQKECNSVGPIALGTAAITGAGNLPAKYVIHAASMELGKLASESNVQASTRSSLQLARQFNLRSIAFPAIGTGHAGFSLSRCAKVMLTEVRNHLSDNTSIAMVEFVLYDSAALNSFEMTFDWVMTY